MKSSTSCFCTSRKYSAIVSADRATRRRVPGGSSIWPKTSAVLSKTPASSISTMRSLPSRVRSPTPANTDTPPWLCATRWIISWMRTVLPTPAPPKRPIFPPSTYGVSRSMTLMPVSNICGLGLELVEGRGLAVDGPALGDLELLALLEVEHLADDVEDVALGDVADGHADRLAGVAHERAADQAVGRLQRDGADHESPRCWATSSVIVVSLGLALALRRQVDVDLERVVDSGIWSDGNSMSTTGPMTRATRPTPGPDACSTAASVVVAVMVFSGSSVDVVVRRRARRRPTRSR